MFSKATEHAIRAIIFLASSSHKEERVSLVMIAKEIEAPSAYTAKILQLLVRSGIASATKGKSGGYFLTRTQLNKTRLMDIVRITEGTDALTQCVIGLRACSEAHPCPVHEQYKAIRSQMRDMLDNTYLSQLLPGIESGAVHLAISKSIKSKK